MARVRLNPTFTEIHGRVGDMVFKRRGNTWYISQRPDCSRRILSGVQKESNARFRAAVQYAKGVLANPEAGKQYEQTGKSVYSSAIADYIARHK